MQPSSDQDKQPSYSDNQLSEMQQHQHQSCKRQYPSSKDIDFCVNERHLKNAYINIRLTFFTAIIVNLTEMVNKHNKAINDYIHQATSKLDHFKIQFKVNVTFVAAVDGSDDNRRTFWLSNKAIPYDEGFLTIGASKLDEKIANFTNLSSGYVIEKVNEVNFTVLKYESLISTTGHNYIATPNDIKRKRAIVNVRNRQDHYCFLYAILSVLKYNEIKHNHNHPIQYQQYFSDLVYDEKDMPMRLINIPKFERDNDISINVIRYLDRPINDDNVDDDDDENQVQESTQFDVEYHTKYNYAKIVNLLLLENGDKSHYCGITSLQKLLNTHDGETRVQRIWCETCLRSFHYKGTMYKRHLEDCNSDIVRQGKTQIDMPPKGYKLLFKDWHKTITPKFTMYADIEAVLEKDYGNKISKHIPIAIAGLLLKPDGSTTYVKFGPSPKCIIDFLQFVETTAKQINIWYKTNAYQPMNPLTNDEKAAYKATKTCHICNLAFDDSDVKVKDHCHFTGNFLGAAHNTCNLQRRIKNPFLPIVFHNLRGYDMHHILKHALSNFVTWNLYPIAQSSEKFLSLSCHIKEAATIKFIDSLQFLGSSLDTIVRSMPYDQFYLINKDLAHLPDIIKYQKGIFPYSYVNHKDRLDERVLPPMKAFYDELIQRVAITQDEYDHAKYTWKTCSCITLGDYMMLYLKLDVYLLADVFQSFRQIALTQDSGLDPLHFLSVPGLSWASALITMKEEVDLLYDSMQYEFFERGIRGGMTFVNQHLVEADEITELLYIDINNLYGWALSQRLPTRHFEWIFDESQLEDLVHNKLPNMECESDTVGYHFMVDMHVPCHLHDFLDDLPLAPETKCTPSSHTYKLLLTHEDKKKYVIHYRVLQFYMKLGIQVTKVHSGMKYEQTHLFKDYIEYNTKQRAMAKNEFERTYYKLKNNSLYGKTVENLKKRTNIRLCNSERKLVTYASKPTMRRTQVIDKDLVGIFLKKERILLDRPVYVGQSVLDLSKLRMYQLQYNEMAKYRNDFPSCSIRIAAGDTDSFFLKCVNISLKHELLPAMICDQLLDTSNYEKENPLYHTKFPSQIGKFKDESCGRWAYKEWCFIRPKCYSLLTTNDGGSKRAKGVQRDVIKTQLRHKDYRHYCLQTRPSYKTCKQRRITSQVHQVFTVEEGKRVIGGLDDKRLWVSDNESRAYGHYADNDDYGTTSYDK